MFIHLQKRKKNSNKNRNIYKIFKMIAVVISWVCKIPWYNKKFRLTMLMNSNSQWDSRRCLYYVSIAIKNQEKSQNNLSWIENRFRILMKIKLDSAAGRNIVRTIFASSQKLEGSEICSSQFFPGRRSETESYQATLKHQKIDRTSTGEDLSRKFQ